MERRLFDASAANDERGIVEVIELMKSIKESWDQIPEVLRAEGNGI